MTQAPTLPPRSPEGQPAPKAPEVVEKKTGRMQRLGRKVLSTFGKHDRPAKTEINTGRGTVATAAGGALLAATLLIGPNVAANMPQEAQGTVFEEEQPGQGTEQEPGANEGEGTEEEPTTPEVENLPDRFDYGVERADIEPLLEEYRTNPNLFLNRPASERMLVSLYFMENLPEFATAWSTVSKNPADAITAEFADPANLTDEQALAYVIYTDRMPTTLRVEGNPANEFDSNAADAMVSGSLLQGQNSLVYSTLIKNTQEQLTTSGVAGSPEGLAVSNYLMMPTINSKSERYTNSAGQVCFNANITTPLNGGAAPRVSDIEICFAKASNGVVAPLRAN